MKKKGKKLIFISQINRDGSGTTPALKNANKVFAEDKFKITRLSLSEKTFIAAGFNSFVVKLKAEKQLGKKIV